MKARVKATGEIVEVKVVEKGFGYNGRQIVFYEDDKGRRYADNQLDFDNPDNTPEDYWTRLEHQYAGMAMQGILANSAFDDVSVADIAITSIKVATSLIKRLKEERK